VKITLYSVEEANRTVAELRPVVERLVAAKREFDRLQRRIAVVSLTLAGATADNPDNDVQRDLVARRNRAAAALRHDVERVHESGCLIKDLDRGLVDFYALAGDRVVFLCWHLGEPEVAHWHTIEGGFAARQPLKTLELE
jgi:hypothetical protein